MPTFIKTGFWEKTKKGYREWLNLDQFVESKIPTPTYKVFTALLTQSGGDDPISVAGDGEQIVLGFTYYIDTNPDNFDLTIYGAPNNNVGTYFIANQTTYLTYTNSLQLLGNTGAPVATVLENTIGNVWFSFESDGNYGVNSSGLFTVEKTALFIGNTVVSTISQNVIFSTPALDSFAIILSSGNLLEQSLTNGVLSSTPIEIRVYN